MKNHNFTYTVLMIVFADAETRIVKEVYRTNSNKKANMYIDMYGKFIYEQGEIDVLGKRYDRADCILTIKRNSATDDLPF